MHISLPVEAPNGAEVAVHRVEKVLLNGDEVTVTLVSYMNATSSQVVWQRQIDMPLVDFTAGTYPNAVTDWLIGAGGELEGGVLVADQPDLERDKDTLKASVNVLREREIAKGATTPSGIVDTDERAVRNIMATYQTAVLAMLTSNPFEVEWRMADNSVEPLDAAAMIAVGNAVLGRTKSCYEHSWYLKGMIDAAADAAALAAVNIQDGWPAVVPPVEPA